MSVEEYYRSGAVRSRIREYCGGSVTAPVTAPYLLSLPPATPQSSWDQADRVPSTDIDELWSPGGDIARSLWDVESLIFLIELDYLNIDQPAEPFLHPAETFLKLEPFYRAVVRLFSTWNLRAHVLMTGRGYHFVGRLPLAAPIVDALAALVPTVPSWFASHHTRRPRGVATSMSARQARASAGLGCVTEFVAHRVRRLAVNAAVPVTFNGTVVGTRGPVGRECVSIDFSHLGDPLDVRHVRVAFSTYQWHCVRPDIFGETASAMPPLVALPRRGRSFAAMLLRDRGLVGGARSAAHVNATLPDISTAMTAVLTEYQASPLAAFHRNYLKEAASAEAPVPEVVPALPPCVMASLEMPNDLLLKPEHLQHVVRALLARGWTAARIARLVWSRYDGDYGWGDRWQRSMDARTRAEFDVRVFAGLVVTGEDGLIDFNCVSAQEKNLCPRSGCQYDLRVDRGALSRQFA